MAGFELDAEEEEEENAPPEEPVNASAVRAQADALPKSVYSGQPQAPLPALRCCKTMRNAPVRPYRMESAASGSKRG